MTGTLRTLEDIEAESDLLVKRRRYLEEQRDKMDQEIGELSVKLQHLEIQRKRLS